MYTCNYHSHAFKDLLLVNPVIKKEVGTPSSLLLAIVHPRRGNSWMRCAEYFYAW